MLHEELDKIRRSFESEWTNLAEKSISRELVIKTSKRNVTKSFNKTEATEHACRLKHLKWVHKE